MSRIGSLSLRGRLSLLFLLAAVSPAGCGSKSGGAGSGPAVQELRVEAACGQCQFDLPGEGCALAVRFGGAAYFVDGTGIDDHGDAHAEDGMCNAVREAVVSGRVLEGRFVAEAFRLVEPDAR